MIPHMSTHDATTPRCLAPPHSSVVFVEASATHLQNAAMDMQRIKTGGGVARASTQAGIVADIQMSAPSMGRGGIGLAGGVGEPDGYGKRPRAEEADVSLEHCSILQLLFPHDGIRADVKALRVAATTVEEGGGAVAFLLPMKWSFVHVVIAPVLPRELCSGMGAYPTGWEAFMVRTAPRPEMQRRCLIAMIELRDVVTRRICGEQGGEHDGVPAILMDKSVVSRLHGRCGSLRWSGAPELEEAKMHFAKKRKDGATVCPIRVGFVPHDCDPLLNGPVLHVLSSDGFYTSKYASMWHGLFSAEFKDATPRGSMEQDVQVLLEHGRREAAMTMLDHVARRKRLARCSDIPCPLCGKTFSCVEETSKHWMNKCLASAAASIQPGKPLYL
jgi:hypothetical protein